MNFESWAVNLETYSATHSCGAKIVAEGDPLNPCGVHPSDFPDSISALDQVRLLRCGLKAIFNAARDQKKRTMQIIEKSKPAVQLANKPKRPVISLKKKA